MYSTQSRDLDWKKGKQKRQDQKNPFHKVKQKNKEVTPLLLLALNTGNYREVVYDYSL